MIGFLIIAAVIVLAALWAGPRVAEPQRTRWGTWLAVAALVVGVLTIPLSYPDLADGYPGWFMALYWAVPIVAALVALAGRRSPHSRRLPPSLTGAALAIAAAVLFLLGGEYTVLPAFLLLATALLDAPRPPSVDATDAGR